MYVMEGRTSCLRILSSTLTYFLSSHLSSDFINSKDFSLDFRCLFSKTSDVHYCQITATIMKATVVHVMWTTATFITGPTATFVKKATIAPICDVLPVSFFFELYSFCHLLGFLPSLILILVSSFVHGTTDLILRGKGLSHKWRLKGGSIHRGH